MLKTRNQVNGSTLDDERWVNVLPSPWPVPGCPLGTSWAMTWPHLVRQTQSLGSRQGLPNAPNWPQHLHPHPPNPLSLPTYFYWWFLCLEVLVGEVAVQPSTILAGHTENQLGIDSPTEAVAGTTVQLHPDTHFKLTLKRQTSYWQDVKILALASMAKKEFHWFFSLKIYLFAFLA